MMHENLNALLTLRRHRPPACAMPGIFLRRSRPALLPLDFIASPEDNIYVTCPSLMESLLNAYRNTRID